MYICQRIYIVKYSQIIAHIYKRTVKKSVLLNDEHCFSINKTWMPRKLLIKEIEKIPEGTRNDGCYSVGMSM